MRDKFAEFYRPSKDEVAVFVTSATVVLDANVLLGLYRLRLAERNQVLDVLDSVKDRLWVPYQVGLEYQRNRVEAISMQAGKLKKTAAIHSARTLEEMQTALRGLSFSGEMQDALGALLPELDSKLRAAIDDFRETVEHFAKEHALDPTDAAVTDHVRDRLDQLLAGKVGDRPEAEKYSGWVREGVRRVSERIPPGYKDADKEKDCAKAGDFLVWVQILEYAKTCAKPILFVTDDIKEDWFERVSGRIVGPRIELLAEFRQHSSQGYHQVTLADFLKLANEYLTARVDPATIEDVSENAEAEAERQYYSEINVGDRLYDMRNAFGFDAFEAAQRALAGDPAEPMRRAIAEFNAAEAAQWALIGDPTETMRSALAQFNARLAAQRALIGDPTETMRSALADFNARLAAQRALIGDPTETMRSALAQFNARLAAQRALIGDPTETMRSALAEFNEAEAATPQAVTDVDTSRTRRREPASSPDNRQTPESSKDDAEQGLPHSPAVG